MKTKGKKMIWKCLSFWLETQTPVNQSNICIVCVCITGHFSLVFHQLHTVCKCSGTLKVWLKHFNLADLTQTATHPFTEATDSFGTGSFTDGKREKIAHKFRTLKFVLANVPWFMSKGCFDDRSGLRKENPI